MRVGKNPRSWFGTGDDRPADDHDGSAPDALEEHCWGRTADWVGRTHDPLDSPDGDLGFVGKVREIRPTVLERLEQDFVPVVASVGVGADGQSYNINADTVAGALARALRAEKVIFLTDVEGLLANVDDPTSIISQTDVSSIQAMLDRGISSGMIPKLEAVCDALRGGVPAAHIIDGRVPHSVLIELLTESGIATKITP